jgi:hypothetical protein
MARINAALEAKKIKIRNFVLNGFDKSAAAATEFGSRSHTNGRD